MSVVKDETKSGNKQEYQTSSQTSGNTETNTGQASCCI